MRTNLQETQKLFKMVHQDEESASARLEKILGYGRFQMFQVWVFSTVVCFIGAMNTFEFTFLVTRKPFRCSLPPHLEMDR